MSLVRSRIDWFLGLAALGLLAIWFGLGRYDSSSSGDPSHPFARLKQEPPTALTLQLGTDKLTIRHHLDADAEPRYEPLARDTPPLDESAIDRLVLGLSSLEVLRDVAGPVDSAQLGFTPTSLTLAFSVDGRETRLVLGRTNQTTEGGRYATLTTANKSRTVVLSEASAAMLEVTPESLIEHRWINWLPSEVRRLKIENGASSFELRQTETGRYLIAGEPERRAKRSEVEAILLRLTSLKVERFLSAAELQVRPARVFGIGQTTIDLEGMDTPNTAQITLGDGDTPCPFMAQSLLGCVSVNKAPCRQGCIRREDVDAIRKASDTLADSHLFFLRYDEIEKLTVSGTGPRLVLERQGSAFQLVEPAHRDVALSAGNSLFKALTQLEGKVVGTCPMHGNMPASTLTFRSGLVGQKGPSDDTVRVFPLNADGSRRICRDDGALLELGKDAASLIDVDPFLLRPPELLNVAAAAVTEIRIRSEQGEQLLTADETGHLQLRKPVFESDAASIESLVEQLSQLRAERWVRKASASEVLSKPETAFVRFAVKSDNDDLVWHELRIYELSNGDSIGLFDHEDAPFVVEHATVALLKGLLADKSAYRLTESDRAFTLSRGEDQIRCDQRPANYTCSKPIQASMLTPMVDALSHLRATHVERVSGALKQTPHAAAAHGAPLVLTVFANGSGQLEPRFRLVFSHADVDGDEAQWVGSVAGSSLKYTYRDSDLHPLLGAMAHQN